MRESESRSTSSYQKSRHSSTRSASRDKDRERERDRDRDRSRNRDRESERDRNRERDKDRDRERDRERSRRDRDRDRDYYDHSRSKKSKKSKKSSKKYSRRSRSSSSSSSCSSTTSQDSRSSRKSTSTRSRFTRNRGPSSERNNRTTALPSVSNETIAGITKTATTSIPVKEIDLMDTQVLKTLETIEEESFVSKTFFSTRDREAPEKKKTSDKVIIDLNTETVTLPVAPTPQTGRELLATKEQIFHPNFIGDVELKGEKWIRKLYNYRQRYYCE